MPTPFREFQAAVRRQNETAIIDMTGVIDASAEQKLNAAYAEAISRPVAQVLLNFADVDYINSTGIALIVGILAQTRKAHLALLTVGLSEHYQEIFRITRLADFMRIIPDEAAVLNPPSPPVA